MSKDNIVTIDSKDYNLNELNDTAKYSIQRIRDYDAKANALKLELKEMEMITANYLEQLRREIKDAKPILQQDTQTENNTEKKI